MAGFREREKRYFPLTDISSVLRMFADQLDGDGEPNLTLLSVSLGYIENALTLNRAIPTDEEASLLRTIFPVVDLDTVEALYVKFESLVKGSVDLTKYPSDYSTRELVKRISDVVWSCLSRNFKDKAHLQSLYSFLTGNKLDCFGVAFGVVAAAQILGRDDIHLALSEDHAWVVFGEDGTDTAEVTWHGKGNEDKRGQSIALSVAEKSWLYLNGHPVICSRLMEVSAMVSAINPSINATTDSIEMGALQQELLWLLYDKGHISKYPMALGNLGDLEEISPTPGRPPPLKIFQQAIDSSCSNYANHHVYPYTYLGGYLYRKRRYRQAIKCWAEASNVIRKFNYTREDEEIYKEFLEIANELVPNIVKAMSVSATAPPGSCQLSLLYDPEAYADILRFYDGICQWEEGSSTPVLHVGWAQHLFASLNKFDHRARAKIDIGKDDEDDDSDEDEDEENTEKKGNDENGNDRKRRVPEKAEVGSVTDSKKPLTVDVVDLKTDAGGKAGDLSPSSSGHKVTARGRKGQRRRVSAASKDNMSSVQATNAEGKEENGKIEEKIKSTIEELASKVEVESPGRGSPNPSITALAQQCSHNILNKNYLLGAGEPFSSSPASTLAVTPSSDDTFTPTSSAAGSSTADTRLDFDEFLSTKSNGTAFIGLTMDSMLKAESPTDLMLAVKRADNATRAVPAPSPSPSPTAEVLASLAAVPVEFHSEKMRGMKKMFKLAKLNASAIKLQLTAQSQVHVKDSRFLDFCEPTGSTRKRPRREIL